MTDKNEFLTADEVASFLRIPQSAVYKLAQERTLPVLSVDDHWLFSDNTGMG